MNSRMTIALRSQTLFRSTLLAAACLLSTAALRAQSAPAASGKIGVISIRQAIVGTGEGKQAADQLQTQFAARQTELQNLGKQVDDIRQRLNAGGATLSQDEQARLTRQGETAAKQLQRKQDEYQEDTNAAQADVMDRIGRKMVDVLDRYSRENGYAVVLDSSAQNTPILFASPQTDVTADIVRLYDQAYPVKGGSASTPKPAGSALPKTPASAPKPTTPTTTPKP
ncbi:MAG: hypothetical protein NVS9B4_23030 [Candidatus Acidiferrum sp.]